jgi:hypothetical protein
MKNYQIKVSICYEIKRKRRCEILNKDEAYRLRKLIEQLNGTIYWFQPVQ